MSNPNPASAGMNGNLAADLIKEYRALNEGGRGGSERARQIQAEFARFGAKIIYDGRSYRPVPLDATEFDAPTIAQVQRADVVIAAMNHPGPAVTDSSALERSITQSLTAAAKPKPLPALVWAFVGAFGAALFSAGFLAWRAGIFSAPHQPAAQAPAPVAPPAPAQPPPTPVGAPPAMDYAATPEDRPAPQRRRPADRKRKVKKRSAASFKASAAAAMPGGAAASPKAGAKRRRH